MSTAKVCLQCGTQFDGNTLFCPHDGSALKLVDPGSALVGQVVADRFLVHKKLGQGGMGEVYLAEQVRIGRKVALKVIRQGLVQDPDSVLRFNREASNAARISHPNVVQVYDFGEAKDGTIFLAMEFIEGESLAALLDRERKVHPRRAVTITTQVASALAAAHDLKIVHRDLKPDNIMLARTRDGSDLVKVVDFGVSRIMDSAEQKVTGTGLVIGTPDYMSPEQFTGSGIDARSDVYSLAMIVFRMLTGEAPFDASNVREALEARFSTLPKRLVVANPRIQWPPGLQEVLDRGMALRVEERYQSVESFATAVAAITTYWDPEEGRIPTTVGAVMPPPTPAGSATGALGGGLIAQEPATPMPTPAPSPAPSPTPSRAPTAPVSPAPSSAATSSPAPAHPAEPRRAGLLWVAVLLAVVVGGGVAIRAMMGGKSAPSAAPAAVASDSSAATAAIQAPNAEDSKLVQESATTANREPPPRDAAPPPNATTSIDAERAQVLQALERLRTLTDSAATPAMARQAIELAKSIAPTTKPGRVERMYRLLEANILLDRTREICRNLEQLAREAPGTRFAAAVEAYAPVAEANCR